MRIAVSQILKRNALYLAFLFAVAIAYNLIYNFNFLEAWSGHAGWLVSENAVVAVLMLVSMCLAFSISRIFFSIVMPLVFAVSAIVYHFMEQYNIMPFSAQTVAFAMETNVDEAMGHVGIELIGKVLIALVISMVVVLLNKKLGKVQRSTKMKLTLFFALISTVLGVTGEFPSPLPLPFGIVQAGYVYWQEDQKFHALEENKQDISPSFTLPEGKNEDLVVVLIIGESVRADRFHINGYHRQTTPHLESLGVVSFPDVQACGTSTRESVPCLLTRATLEDTDVALRETSLVSVFRGAGFFTAWVSNHRVIGASDTPVTSIASEAHFTHFGNRRGDYVYSRLLDEQLLPLLDQVLGNPNPRKLIVLHTVGSHWNYEQHYTDAFRVFTPVCNSKVPRNCTEEELFNSYDNSILYTDHFIREVIERVKPFRTLVVFVGDHGESLGEGGRFLHGHEERFPEQIQVPLLVWSSQRYQADEPEKIKRLQTGTNRSISHDHVFHSVLDGAGFESPLLDLGRSLFR